MNMLLIILIASGVVMLLAVGLYAAGAGKAVKLPATVLAGIGGVGVGVAMGLGLSAVYGGDIPLLGATYSPNDPSDVVAQKGAGGPRSTAPTGQVTGGRPGGPGGGMGGGPGGGGGGMGGMMGGGGMGGMMGGGGGMGGMMGGGGMGGGRGPNPKTQLATLVTKLDQLTKKPLFIELNDEKRLKVHEQLKGLGDLTELSTEEAKTRFDALLKLVEEQKPVLEAAGYRWPAAAGAGPGGGGAGGAGGGRGGPAGGGGGGGGFGPPADVPNPFKQDANAEHLKSLESTLTTAKPAA